MATNTLISPGVLELENDQSFIAQQPVTVGAAIIGPTVKGPVEVPTIVTAVPSCVPDEHEFSFEGHPNNTTREHLQALFDIGFRRVSFGVQDNDPEVLFKLQDVYPDTVINIAGDEYAVDFVAPGQGRKATNWDFVTV